MVKAVKKDELESPKCINIMQKGFYLSNVFCEPFILDKVGGD